MKDVQFIVEITQTNFFEKMPNLSCVTLYGYSSSAHINTCILKQLTVALKCLPSQHHLRTLHALGMHNIDLSIVETLVSVLQQVGVVELSLEDCVPVPVSFFGIGGFQDPRSNIFVGRS